jgi:hypothetical protein
MVSPLIDPGSHVVQHQDARKNYIGIVNDTTDEEQIAESAARWQPHVMSYLFGRLAAVLKRTLKGTIAP